MVKYGLPLAEAPVPDTSQLLQLYFRVCGGGRAGNASLASSLPASTLVSLCAGTNSSWAAAVLGGGMVDVLDVLYLYYMPAIILVGLLGNVLSCVVFLNTHLKLRSSSYYLAALAVADCGFLTTLLLVWLNSSVGVQVFNRNGWCQSLVYMSSVFSFLSVWLIVAFTVERFIAVQYPLHRPRVCTVSRAKTIVLGLVGVALPSHIYSFWTAGLVQQDDGTVVCEMLPEYHEIMRAINIVDSLVTLILPVLLIIFMNAMITRKLVHFGRRFRQQSSSGTDASRSVEGVAME
ncbi:neuropeptides capa receptor-like [Schistocerca piceifrons]|uniref:neuropeptides capa receptor-like n=1 Tax=Schistocerca piceifrons TaxID=274613 RepID=UPI001F5F6DF5|nr:neuropeptides capa receptor-like [Schistocerca piceifrons]